MSKTTIFDVAKSAGVSIKTVSRVVNHEPNVRPSTRDRVNEAIEKLKYRPDQSARNLASHRSHLIGLVYDDPAVYDMPTGGYILDLQQGALRASKAARCELLIHPCDFRRRNVGAELKSLIQQTRVAGIVVAAPLSNMPKIIRAIEETGTPLVRLSPGKQSVRERSVTTNDREVCSEMTRYLAGLGHKRIAFITGNPDHKAVAKRFLGYKDGLKASGLKFSERLVVAGDNSFGSGQAAAERLLQRKQPPSAIFAANDDMAAGVVRIAHRRGLKIPEQLSVAGFDDIALARQIDPTLTTIRQPLVRMAEQAVAMLANNNGNGEDANIPNTVCIPATIKIRESTGPAPD